MYRNIEVNWLHSPIPYDHSGHISSDGQRTGSYHAHSL